LNDKQPAPVPSPTDREQQEIEIARTRLVDRRRPARAKVQSKHYGSRSFSSPHADHAGFRARLADALGTASPDFVDASLHQLVQAVSHCDSPEGGSEMELNAALALIESVRPTNEIEAALALQMAATHRLAMEMMGGLRRGITANAPISGGLATKLLRAFAGQFELLDRLRRSGRQIVRVEHVTVQSGGQAIVGHVEAPTLEGQKKSEEQCYAVADARVIEVPSPHQDVDVHAGRQAVVGVVEGSGGGDQPKSEDQPQAKGAPRPWQRCEQ
jgi:hypothetical protein